MNDPKMVRTVVMATLKAAFDRAVEKFRNDPDGDHFIDTLEAIVTAMHYAAIQTDRKLAAIIGDTPPRDYVKVLRMHEEVARGHSGTPTES